MDLVNAYSIFIQVYQNVGALFFSNLCLTSSNIAFHTACEWSTSEMDVDRAILAATYRQAFLSFETSTSRLSQSLLFTRAFGIHNPVDVTSQ